MYQSPKSNLYTSKRKRRGSEMPKAPKSAKTAYNFFQQKMMREYANRQDLHQPRQCLAGSIGQLWKKLNEAERQPYKDMAQQDQVRFKTEYADYMSMLRQGLSEKDAARAEIHAKNVQTESKTSLSVAKGPTNSGRSIGNETPPPSNPKVRLRKKARKEIDIGKVNELVGKECDLTPNLTPKDTFDGFELDDFELTPIEYPSLDDGMNTGLLDFFNPQFADNSVSPRLFGDPILFY